MLTTLYGAKCVGIEAVPVTVEVDITNGIGIHLVGLADIAVKESLLRTVTALQTIGYRIPGRKIVINLAPADMHKKGSGYDLPIAIGIIASSGQEELPLAGQYLIMGELGLDGTVRNVSGALPMAGLAAASGFKGCILPYESGCEAAEYHMTDIHGVRRIEDVVRILKGEDNGRWLLRTPLKAAGTMACGTDFPSGTGPRTTCTEGLPEDGRHNAGQDNGSGSEPRSGDMKDGIYVKDGCPAEEDIMDFSEIVGQEGAKRGLEIAAAGNHNVLLIGPPGAGKSSLAKAVANILPPMSVEEAIQTSKIYSVAGKGGIRYATGRVRPFRSPHYSASIPALVGGGSDNIMPGEISLAHNGILFLDELCEAPKKVIEALRGPMEEKKVTISRLRSKIEYPADFMLIAATNPCPCGYFGEGDRCTCTPARRTAYLSKLSGPIMDRIDIHLWLRPVDARNIVKRPLTETSAAVAERVMKARDIQGERFKGEGIFTNSAMNSRQIRQYCNLSSQCQDFLEKAIGKAGLSARACNRILKLSRTIADLEGCPEISMNHLAEAIGYRFLDKPDILM